MTFFPDESASRHKELNDMFLAVVVWNARDEARSWRNMGWPSNRDGEVYDVQR